jgi:hypothetical protein
MVGGVTSMAASYPRADVEMALGVDVLSSGWVQTDSADGQNRLVPSITLIVRNASQERLHAVQVNAVFRRGSDGSEWGNRIQRAALSRALDPDETTPARVVTGAQGYTSVETPDRMLVNSSFVDATVELFGRYGPTSWVKLGTYPIERVIVLP